MKTGNLLDDTSHHPERQTCRPRRSERRRIVLPTDHLNDLPVFLPARELCPSHSSTRSHHLPALPSCSVLLPPDQRGRQRDRSHHPSPGGRRGLHSSITRTTQQFRGKCFLPILPPLSFFSPYLVGGPDRKTGKLISPTRRRMWRRRKIRRIVLPTDQRGRQRDRSHHPSPGGRRGLHSSITRTTQQFRGKCSFPSFQPVLHVFLSFPPLVKESEWRKDRVGRENVPERSPHVRFGRIQSFPHESRKATGRKTRVEESEIFQIVRVDYDLKEFPL